MAGGRLLRQPAPGDSGVFSDAGSSSFHSNTGSFKLAALGFGMNGLGDMGSGNAGAYDSGVDSRRVVVQDRVAQSADVRAGPDPPPPSLPPPSPPTPRAPVYTDAWHRTPPDGGGGRVRAFWRQAGLTDTMRCQVRGPIAVALSSRRPTQEAGAGVVMAE